MTTKEIRAKVMERPGVEKVRVGREEIHAYGIMPNSNVRGWWFVAYRYDVDCKGPDIL